MNMFIKATQRAAIDIVVGSVIIFSFVFLVVGSMFGIAYLVDEYSTLFMLLYLLWFLLMVMLVNWLEESW